MSSMTWTREFLAAIPDTSISGRRVARELTTLIERRGKSGMIVFDHGTEFTGLLPVNFVPFLFLLRNPAIDLVSWSRTCSQGGAA